MKRPAPISQPIAVRAFPVILDQEGAPVTPQHASQPPVPALPCLAMAFDCETRISTDQRLTVGFAVVLQSNWRRNRHEVASLICFADEAALSGPERQTLIAWLADSLATILARVGLQPQRLTLAADLDYQAIGTFRETFYTLAYYGRAAVGAFNLSWDLSRLAERSTPTKDGRGHTFTLITHTDSRGRQSTKVRHPRIRIMPIDGHRALVQFTGTKPRYDGYFVDLKTLGDALTGERFKLATGVKAFGLPEKHEHQHDGRVTRQLLDYALNDALVTAELYVAELEEYRRHPIAKGPNQIYSEATIGKAYLQEMGLHLPELVLDPSLVLD